MLFLKQCKAGYTLAVRKRSAIFLLWALPICVAVPALAQTVPQLLATIDGTTQYRDASVSPDGRYVTWTVNLRNPDGSPATGTEIWWTELARGGAGARRVEVTKSAAAASKNAAASHSVAWSANSGRMAFLSDAETPGQLQVYVAQPGGAAKKLTGLKGFPQRPRWSPDGTKIALLFTENATHAAGPREPAAKLAGVAGEQNVEQRLVVVDAATGEMTPVTPADTYVYEYDWSPDAAQLVYTAAKGNGDNNWWIAGLYTVPAAGGEPHSVHQPELQIAEPHFSPDGKQIAFIGGLMSDEGATGGDIFVIPSGTGGFPPRNLTAGRYGSAAWLKWLPSGKILFAELADGGTSIGTLDPASRETNTVWKGAETLQAGADPVAVSADGAVVATVRHSWTNPPEVWAGAAGAWTQMTRANASLTPMWGKAESIHWRSDDFDVQGWMIYPLNYDPAKKYPLVVSVHGGPAGMKRPAWPGAFDATVLSSQGYFVFFPNPRGSFGFGEAFTKANVRDFGRGDLRDILLGLDTQLRVLPVDARRLGIAGWSYGGYMAMWAVTQTRRFHAAFAGAGIANWQSYYGENRIDQWMIPYFGASVYDMPEVYAKSSPMNFILNAHTPTLIAVGDSDAECPAPQSEEFWHALKTLGVKTELVVYKDEGHAIRQPAHVKDLVTRTIAWFNENLSEEAVSKPEPARATRPGQPVRAPAAGR